MRSELHSRSLHVARVREHALGLVERQPVGVPDHVAHRRAVVLAGEVRVDRVVPQLVGGAVLMDQPHDLALVLHEVGGELQRDHGVDLQPVGLGDVEAAPDGHLMRELRRRVPLARDLHEVGLVTGGPQRAHEALGVGLGPAADERRLRMQDGDPHGAARPRRADAAARSRRDLRLGRHQPLGEAGRELGVVGDQAVVAPRDRPHHAEQPELHLTAPARRRREVPLAVGDDDLLVGAQLRREVVEAVADLGRVHPRPRGAFLRPVELAREIAVGGESSSSTAHRRERSTGLSRFRDATRGGAASGLIGLVEEPREGVVERRHRRAGPAPARRRS